MIENPDRLDIFAVHKDGGADLVIVSSGKLDDSAKTQKTLLDKIENYLMYLNSDDFKEKCPNASAQNTHIILKLSEEPPALILKLAEQIIPWVAEFNATFTMEW